MATREKTGRKRPPVQTNRPQRPQRKSRPKREWEDVVYTQPKPFQRNRFLLRLATVLAVVIAIVMGISVFFKVENITVSGASRYTAWEIREASGIREGSQLLGISEAQISGRIISQLPYVGSIRVSIKLPDTVHIDIVEMERQELYGILDQNDTWWLISGEGRVLQQTDSATVAGCTRIEGVKLQDPQAGEQAMAWQPEPEATEPTEDTTEAATEATEPSSESTDPTETTQPTEATQDTATAAQKLEMALALAEQLAANNLKDKIASIQVEDLTQLEFWYTQQYQVKLGDGSNLAYKVNAAAMAIRQLASYESGVLDASFTTWPDQVGYTPFGNADN